MATLGGDFGWLINLLYRKYTKCGVLCLWRRERDSNPRVLAHKLISSQPRYDHFDISPYIIKLKTSLIFAVYLAGRPVMSSVAVSEIFCSQSSQNFDRCHSFLLALSATGSARKRPHFDISPYCFSLTSLLYHKR